MEYKSNDVCHECEIGGMSDYENDAILSVLLVVTFSIAEDIYFRKCMFYNVPRLSDSDKKERLRAKTTVSATAIGARHERIRSVA